MSKKGEHLKFERKIKPSFMVYADFESILVPEDNEKKNRNQSYTIKYQKILLVVMTINYYVLMLNLVRFLNHTKAKMLFASLIAV